MFKRFLALAAVAFVLICFTYQFPRIRLFAGGTVQAIARPFFQATAALTGFASNLRHHFYDYWTALAKQHELQQQIDELESRLINEEEILRENARLKQLLEFRDTLPPKSVGARVVGYGLKPWKKSILLDKGTQHNIQNMSPIVVPSGLVGRVVDAGPLSAQAIFLTDPDSRVTAMTLNSRAQGVVEGNGTEKLQLRYLNLDDHVEVGEIVVTSGVSDIYPKGLRVGRIESVERDADGLHLTATVRPAVRFSKVEEVLCLRPSDSK